MSFAKNVIRVAWLTDAALPAGSHYDTKGGFSADLTDQAVDVWLNPAESEVNVRWARDFWKALQPFAGGAVYVNDRSHDDEDRIRSGYGASYGRLAARKKKYDPDSFFRLNPDITPAP